MGEWGTCFIEKRGETDADGIFVMPSDVEASPHWLPYVRVSSVDAITVKVKELKAKVYREPTDIPNIGRFAVLGDLTGAVFAVFKGIDAYGAFAC